MSETAALLAEIKTVAEATAKLAKDVEDLKKPVAGGANPAALFGASHIRNGEDPLSSRGYSMLRAIGYARGLVKADEAKVEIEVHRQLHENYVARSTFQKVDRDSFLVPFSSQHIALMGNEKVAREIGSMVRAGVTGYDAEEVAQYRARFYGGLDPATARRKALSWTDESSGGALVAPPMMGELIELFRNNLALMAAGVRDIGMPPSGRITFPRQTGASTFNWIGESQSIAESTPTTGDIILSAKKAAVRVTIPNELIRFASVGAEQFVREDMAKVMALGVDKALLEGVGSSVAPKGLINFAGITTYTASTVGADGNTFEPEDAQGMIAAVEEKNATFGGFIGRPSLYGKIRNRRSDAVAAGDKKGPFLFDVWRSGNDNMAYDRDSTGNLCGYQFTKSTQVSNTRVKGGSSALTYVLGGDFSDYVMALGGVVEFAVNQWGDTIFSQDQTQLRAIMYADGAPRHEASFVVCDTLVVA